MLPFYVESNTYLSIRDWLQVELKENLNHVVYTEVSFTK